MFSMQKLKITQRFINNMKDKRKIPFPKQITSIALAYKQAKNRTKSTLQKYRIIS
jgi:hypothetical protein